MSQLSTKLLFDFNHIDYTRKVSSERFNLSQSHLTRINEGIRLETIYEEISPLLCPRDEVFTF